MDFVAVLACEFSLRPEQVRAVIELLDAGNTVPFIARYRKEAHGTLDDQVIRELSERLDYLRNLQKRKEEVGEAIAAQEAMTGELQAALDAAGGQSDAPPAGSGASSAGSAGAGSSAPE